jgi:ribosomal protein L9
MKIFSKLLPKNIEFYRTPISSTSPAPQRHSPSIPAASAMSAAAQEKARPQGPQKISIYGSVTTTDIAENLKAILAEDGEGSRVVLTSEDIVFVRQGEEKDRVKHLGTYEIDIKVKGATAASRRTITVKAQEQA